MRYIAWLNSSAPRLVDYLAPPAPVSVIRDYEQQIQMDLPRELVAVWGLHAGQQKVEELGYAPFMGMEFLSPAESLGEWRRWQEMWAEQDADARTELREFCTSVPPEAIRPEYVTRGWIPVFKEPLESNYIGTDLNPGPTGKIGQVINFGRDEDRKVVIAWSLSDLLAFVAADVESGAVYVEPPPQGYTMPDIRREGTRCYLCYLTNRAELEGPLA